MRQRLASKSRRIGDYERNVIVPEYERTISEALAQRLGVDPAADPRPDLIAAVAVGAWNAARKIWLQGEGAVPMQELLRRAFDFIAPGSGDAGEP